MVIALLQPGPWLVTNLLPACGQAVAKNRAIHRGANFPQGSNNIRLACPKAFGIFKYMKEKYFTGN
jgi:hypothetical protein